MEMRIKEPCRKTRRQFLWAAGGLAAGAGWTWAAGDRLRRFRKEGPALGAKASVTLLHADASLAENALEAAFAELNLVEEIMSLYRPDSQVSRLNRTGRLMDPHPYLKTVLVYAKTVSEATGGAFDITVQPLWAAYAEAKKRGSLPDPAAITSALEKIDWRQIEVSETGVRLAKQGAAITLNGIAQGFAADRVAAVLKAHGIEHALVDAGELEPLGASPDGAPWKVGIQHPRVPDAFVALSQLSGRCLATSGDYESAFSADFSRHHIFDPATGTSPLAFSSVSIAAPSAMEADALSTALFVLGPDRGLAVLEASFPGSDALLVFSGGRVRATKGFPFAAA